MKKRIISILLILMLVFCGTVFAFGDIDFGQWDSGGQYPRDIMNTRLQIPVISLMDRGIVTGDDDGLFHPERSISRAEFATMMARATNNDNDLENMKNLEIFNDLEGYTWAKPYINAVTRANLFTGRSGNRFAPGESVTYAEVITVIIRMNAGTAGVAESMAANWPDNYIRFARTHNLTGLVVVHDWSASATRGDVAQILHRNLPGAASDHVRSVTVNRITAVLRGSAFSVSIGSDNSALISISARNPNHVITVREQNGADLGSGTGVFTDTVLVPSRPYVIEFSVINGPHTRNFTLTIN